ncbi:MAG: cytochrome c1 [Steroidobacterales bacterium]
MAKHPTPVPALLSPACALLRAGLLSFALLLAPAPLLLAAEGANALVGTEESKPVEWESWRAGNEVSDLASLQRGARNFMSYCVGCHSLKYLRYQRMAADLEIPGQLLTANLIPPTGDGPRDYITGVLQSADGEAWFGKAPPDLSLITRSKGADYVYRFLKTFYSDPTRQTGSNNLAYDGAAMPAVLSDLEGVKAAVYRDVKTTVDGKSVVEKKFDHFETTAPGNMTPEQFDVFVRDTVNFLDYAGEPAQVARRGMGIWVVLFLLVFTGFAWLLKREYWKEVH